MTLKEEDATTLPRTVNESQPIAIDSDRDRDRSRIYFFVVLALALGLRIGWWLMFVDVIENEGLEYARMAENLLAGDGLVGIYGGRNVMFPPFFPALLALVSVFTGEVELAGRLIGLVCGTALVGLLFALARHIVNARTALVVGLFAATQPLLVALSVSLYTEGLFIFLVVASVYLIVRSFTAPSAIRLITAGLAMGVAYLTRPEGIAFIAYFTVAIAMVGALQRRRPIAIARHTGVFLAASLVVAVPYMVHLSALAGTFRWEGKSDFVNIQNERLHSGWSIAQATRGLDSEGNPVGLSLNLHTDQAVEMRAFRSSSNSLLTTLTTDLGARAKNIARNLTKLGMAAAPWVYVPLLIGAFVVPWRRHRLWEGLLVLGILPAQALLLLTVYQDWARYYFTLVPLIVFWSGAGLVWIASAVSNRLPAISMLSREKVSLTLSVTFILGFVAVAYGNVRSVGELNQAEDRVSREIGELIATDATRLNVQGRPVLMGLILNSAFYAKGTMRYLPEADEHAALGYIHRVAPHYIVLRDFEVKPIPYAGEWLQRGVPDKCAVPLERKWSTPDDHSRVWRWQCATQSSSTESTPQPTPAAP